LGNAFVVVWRIGDEQTLLRQQRNAGRARGNSGGGSGKKTFLGIVACE
jgi:hypothetical protein